MLAGCRKRASDEIDFGTLTGSVYQNRYFGFTLTLPKDWSVQDQKVQQRLMKKGAELIAGDDRQLKAAVKASELTTVNLVAAFQHPIGSPVPYNPNIISVAEMTREMPGIKRGSDYLFQAKKMLQASQMKVSFPKDFYPARIGGVGFDVMDAEMSAMGTTVKQRYFVTIKKGYALCFIVSFSNDKESDMVQKVLDTLAFN